MKLLYKELALTAHPSSLVFALLGCLVIVPAYPYSAIFLFGCLAPYLTFVNARETNDLWYTALLPVSRRDSVRGKWLLTVFLQLFQLLFSLPFVLLRQALGVADNPVGLDATPAWYGLALAAYAAFDLVFFAAYFKSGYKAGKAFLLAALPLAAGDGGGGKRRAHSRPAMAGQRFAGKPAPAGSRFAVWHGLLRGAAAAGVQDRRPPL